MRGTLPDWCYAHNRATDRQKAALRKAGIAFNEQTLTKRAASSLISSRLSSFKSRGSARQAESESARQAESESEAWTRRGEEGWGPGGY